MIIHVRTVCIVSSAAVNKIVIVCTLIMMYVFSSVTCIIVIMLFRQVLYFFRRVIAKVCYNLARLLSEILVTEECLARFLQLILQDFPVSLARLDKRF